MPKLTLKHFRYRILFPGIIILLIPSITATVLMFSWINFELSNSLANRTESAVSATMNNFDAEIELMQHVYNSMLLNEHLDPYYLRRSKFACIKAVKELKQYADSSRIVDQVLFYNKGHEYIYSSDCRYSLNEKDPSGFFSMMNVKKNDFFNDVRSGNSIQAYGDKVYFYISDASKQGSRVAIFVVEAGVLRALIASGNSGENTYLYDFSGNIILAADRFTSLPAELRAMELNVPPFTAKKHIGGKNYIVANVLSKVAKNGLLRLAEEKIMLGDLLNVRIPFITIQIIVLIISNIAYLLLNKKSTKFVASINRQAGGTIKDISQLNTAVENVFKENKNLIEQNTYYLQKIRCEFSKKLLLGGIMDSDEFISEIMDMGVINIYPEYRILMVEVGGDRDIGDIVSRIQIPSALASFYLEQDFVLEFHIVVLTCSKLYNERFRENFSSFDQIFETEYIISRSIENVNLFGKEFYILYSYMRTVPSCNYLPENYQPEVLHNYNSDLIEQRIEQALLYIRADILTDITIDFLNVYITDGSYLFSAYICYDFLSSLNRALRKYNILTNEVQDKYIDVIASISAGNINHVKMCILALINVITASEHFFKRDFDHVVKASIEFIVANYPDPSLNVQKIASALNYSYKYISRHFKDETGYNLSDYIHKVRIDKFKDLVKMKEMNNKQIAKAVGYNDIDSLYSRFKKIEGITVDQYMQIKTNAAIDWSGH